MAEETLTVAAIGDIHVGENSAHPYRELFHEIAGKADVLALCGDLTNHGKPREAEILAEDLRAIGIPVVAVLGNHDYECGLVEESQRILEQAGVRFVDGAPQEIRGVGFAGVKGFGGGFGSLMLDSFGESAIKQFVHESVSEAMRLESALRQLETERIFVLLHYAPIAATVVGEPTEIYPFLGSSRLAETIDRFETVRAVAHGHAHHGTFSGHTLRGTPVYNVAQTIPKEGGRPYALITV
ncbi:metallophosphoesterase family protein [Azospirillum doebereinerae]|uniref:Metallophosphoesterase n=1 Tax=Azospirillum doebereinerae TaxID=92933 RepID=A0A433J3C7_9PROT|nr:metallophosphoesterase [Azospirillum doebereinerae]MCG5243675.1 metallophosphoesterase [Azospirillum doebereinerae]RUQ66235.1 metallophosphoesterase [Azospirillum doebereinerae]